MNFTRFISPYAELNKWIKSSLLGIFIQIVDSRGHFYIGQYGAFSYFFFNLRYKNVLQPSNANLSSDYRVTIGET